MYKHVHELCTRNDLNNKFFKPSNIQNYLARLDNVDSSVKLEQRILRVS